MGDSGISNHTESFTVTDKPVLSVREVTKKYPGTIALDHVTLDIYPGKVNVIMGENGAGKSTLMKIIAGVESPTSGNLILDGETIQINSAGKALDNGIGIIYQELTVCPNLSVTDNIFLAREIKNRFGMVDQKKQRIIALEMLNKLEQPIHPDLPVNQLRVGQQQLVEIARSLKDNVRILIMDEPTSALSRKETSILTEIVRDVTSRGVAVIYISHKLDECLEIGDRFAVLRDGKLVGQANKKDASLSWIIKHMAGKNPDELYPETNHKKGNVILKAENYCLPRVQGEGYLVDRVSFTLHSGEITGIYGLMGAGRTELLESLFGLHNHARGKLVLDGKVIDGLPIEQRIRNGLMLIPEDRQKQGLVQTLSVAENMTLSSLKSYQKSGFLSNKLEKEAVCDYIRKLIIRLSDPDQPVVTLSGGNQQKVVIAKCMLTNPKVLMMDEPTRGVDVGAKYDIFKIMSDFAARDTSVLFTSSELREIMEMSDRVLVLARGRITADLRGPDITEKAILDACVIQKDKEKRKSA